MTQMSEKTASLIHQEKLSEGAWHYLNTLMASSFPLSLDILAEVKNLDEALVANWPLVNGWARQAAELQGRIVKLAESCVESGTRGPVRIVINAATGMQLDPTRKAAAVYAGFDADEGIMRYCRLDADQAINPAFACIFRGMTVLCQPCPKPFSFSEMEFSAPVAQNPERSARFPL